MLSRVEEIVAAQLEGQPIECIPNGYRYTVGSGTTELTFRPTAGPPGAFALCAIATIETQFVQGIPNFNRAEIARLNRRCAFGSFHPSDHGIRGKLTFSIYRQEPAAQWVAEILLTALSHQFAFGIAAAQAEVSEELLRANRANLEYPRQWTYSVTQREIAACAAQFRERGLVSTAGPHGLVLEVPLAKGGRSRMLDPTSETALIHTSTDIRHPTAGVGYLGTIALPFDPSSNQITWWCEHLNTQEHKQEDFVPRLGAWGVRGMNDQLVYSLFWPTNHGNVNVLSNIANWLIQRTHWLRENYWAAGTGLRRGMATNDG
ncbi:MULTISPECIES: hypothetical protein [unclassified Ensifer]|uniref:hypothetical protein n=1 Tax=unclassified Ensifer TaxID=2633371 RepID=UPI0007130613|nr:MULTISPECIES: hypothetical protein [unclassified Ensifer]KQX40910.1 hypothetical protein ASD49_15730 [Ensifer sp. Root1298]KQX70231.1 hypothetical protein ASD41_16805 [Ensifer sp. Root1312]KRC14471.1 hypothetical protein ASE29_17285 [Ensifer sp. Root74]KRD57009.1 hypothetical protein ASE71_10700 [Ensifer sp. Root954]